MIKDKRAKEFFKEEGHSPEILDKFVKDKRKFKKQVGL